MTRTHIVKIVSAFGVTSMGVMALVLMAGMSGCSGESVKSIENVKIDGKSPGEYRDAVDPPVVKGKKGRAAR